MPSQLYPPTVSGQAKQFTNAPLAVAYVKEIYDANTAYLREHFQLMANGRYLPERISACYPYAAITTTRPTQIDTRLAFGFVPGVGRYSTTLTRPDLFARYYGDQFRLLLENHQVPLEIGVSNAPIPIHFAFNDGLHVEGGLKPESIGLMREIFDLP